MASVIPVSAHRRSASVVWLAVALIVTAVGGALAANAAHRGDLPSAAADLAVAVVFVACGAMLWVEDPTGDLSGLLMMAIGAAWLLGDLAAGLALLHRGPLVQLLVTAPVGRPRTWPERLVVVAGYGDALVPGAGRDERATVALAAVVAAFAVWRWARAGGVQRRARAVPAAAAVAIALVLVAGTVAAPGQAQTVLWGYELVLVLTAAAMFVDLRRRSATGVVSKVVIDLGDTPAGGSLTGALARAVGDPSLVIGYVREGGVVDERGRQVDLPSADADRVVTPIEAEGEAPVVLVHDRAALQAPGAAQSVAAAVRLALHNLRLESEIRAGVSEVGASRERLLAARDLERRSLEARLRAAVDDRLQRAARLLAGLEEAPDPLVSALPGELSRASHELERFAAGLHPAGLEAGGLPVALLALAAASPLPVDVDAPCDRLAPEIELAAWFVCSEALANVTKHAAAERATIHVQRSGARLVITVADDGRGGADPAAGRGLRGLVARVEALGGSLEVGQRPGGGTGLRAWLPARERT
jgi:signal transduction histidine kinase